MGFHWPVLDIREVQPLLNLCIGQGWVGNLGLLPSSHIPLDALGLTVARR